MSIKILLVEDHQLFLTGLRTMLMQQPGMLIIGEAKDGLEAVNLSIADQPDVVIMDISMPGMNGIEATHRIKKALPGARVLGLSMYADSRFVLAAIEAGAAGYILKDSALEELILAIQTVVANQTYLSPGVAGVVVEAYKESKAPEISPLTPREREVLQLITEGNSTRDIAARLHVSQKTISSHRENLMKKLDIHSVAGLTKYAIQQGMTMSEL